MRNSWGGLPSPRVCCVTPPAAVRHAGGVGLGMAVGVGVIVLVAVGGAGVGVGPGAVNTEQALRPAANSAAAMYRRCCINALSRTWGITVRIIHVTPGTT